MRPTQGLIKAGLLLVAVVTAGLILLFALPQQPITQLAMGEATSNTAPAVRISLAPQQEPEPEAPPEQPSEPEPQPKPEPEPEPKPAPKPEPEPEPEPKPEPAPEPPAETSPPESSVTTATDISESTEPQNQQVQLEAGSSARIDEYLNQLSRHLSQHYQYPRRARRLGQEGTPLVVFSFDREGELLELHLKTGSGHQLLDDAALEMLRDAEPLPAVPARMNGQSFSYALPVRFRLR
ncbi:energy transducer TonB [Marinobacter similis]|uniref:Cell envelope biogenesis protein TonB n=1 Tax=Marinobacter similis TaxID=1420916 RepID=W5YHF7_9GAMM|nr:energy transducer TonB [Marinobacter similis]AHI28521.1 cell envelope biogenesis protein TonB [Marinobacter similis]